MNLPSATVSMQVVIGLCKRKETVALNFYQSRRFIGVLIGLLYDGFFSFAVVRQLIIREYKTEPTNYE